MLSTCCPYGHTTTCCRGYVQGKHSHPLVHSTHDAHSRHAGLDMPLSKGHTHTRYMLCATHGGTHHTSGAHHTHSATPTWCRAPQSHTQCTEHTRTCTLLQPRGSPPALRPQLRAPHPCKRPVLSCRDTRNTWTLAGAEHQVSMAESCPVLLRAWARILSTLLSQLPPPEALFPPQPPSPFLEPIPSSISSEPQGTSWAPGTPAGPPVGPTAAASPSCCSQGPRLGLLELPSWGQRTPY